ncbi:MAG: threonine--tRNA ligase, partial [Methanophagales archaeon]|nr:threonine--tRNA ligase [Methanophagales archaeon]
KKKTRVAEEIIEDTRKKERIEEALVAFIAVESEDEKKENLRFVIENAAEEARSIFRTVNAERIVLYPYAHLSSELASPAKSIEILRGLEEELRSSGIEVTRAPFGWYKSFTIRCKGHPLSELSRKIAAPAPVLSSISSESESEAETKSTAVEAEEKAISRFFFIDEDGSFVEPDDFEFGSKEVKNLRKFFVYESEKRREVDKIPPHVELMKRLEIADYEPSSDPGNLRFYPKGKLIKSLLEDHVRNSIADYGAVEVETPIMYSASHPSLKDYLEKFPARQYSISGKGKGKGKSKNKRGESDLFLRFAACFGQFLISKEMSISYKNLPLKIFELAPSFRKEKRGELAGLRRLRKFTMPDMHTLCKDMDEALLEFRKQYELCMRVLTEIGFSPMDYEVGLRFTKEFYEGRSAKEFINRIARISGKPVLVEMWDQRYFYFVLKFEFNFVDASAKASALSTVQIDVENAERYGISYTDADGTQRHPVILHCSPSGAIERCIYALLEKAYMDMNPDADTDTDTDTAEGVMPVLPLWLSPTQLRLIPVAERHLKYISEILSALTGIGNDNDNDNDNDNGSEAKARIRVDIDDRDETVSKKIRDAGREWVPYVAVVGDKEVEKKTVSVRIREGSSKKKQKAVEMNLPALKELIEAGVKGKPFRQLPLPVRLSERAKFVGWG